MKGLKIEAVNFYKSWNWNPRNIFLLWKINSITGHITFEEIP
jgi:hypothetical protein